ncbi:DUF3541 domain-containing protein [Psychromonas sp. SP041]|uniref:DUF3541 domain-containing protein n=1 Tax=Psychromonas sp. SP041 TaxID=1365007 RepID=UPI0004199443|nr:DUF3541 domain-containing protein [Psychromonas sp. SP041]
MKTLTTKISVISFLLLFITLHNPAIGAPITSIVDQDYTTSTILNGSKNNDKLKKSGFKQDAELIRRTYEANLYTLPAFKSGHYGLRMYRQTLDNKYAASVWSDMARVASRLNMITSEIYTAEEIDIYSKKRIIDYRDEANERKELRYQATIAMPEYLYLGVGLLGSMARADEYGLKHREDKKLREVIRRYDFTKYVTDEKMVKAWAAQLANQVYWLRQLGEQNVVEDFITTLRKVYPDNNDSKLSDQQFGNKIYGLTHIIFAASGYYQHPINEQDYQWLYDYYRNNIDIIIERAKEDVIAEVGINFLLAGLDDDPVVLKTRKAIQKALNREHGLVPSVTGEVDLKKGEHRNVLAIMLLDWKGMHVAPTITKHPEVFNSIPYGLVEK